MAAIFNVFEYIEGAEKVGIKREHAEYNAKQIFKFLEDNMSTKKDLLILEDSILSKINMVDKDLRKDMNGMETSLRQELINVEYRIMIRLGSLMVICSGVIISVLGFILKG